MTPREHWGCSVQHTISATQQAKSTVSSASRGNQPDRCENESEGIHFLDLDFCTARPKVDSSSWEGSPGGLQQ
ncbi:hypothetical protein H9L39_01930 [Fusarium oxysporum f. sp. albedinis]|nr:hypothetical protein H9L39_01930 [Fusarium oxysporum f. sp. albedinis]